MRPYLSALGASWPTWCLYLDPVRLSQNVTCHGPMRVCTHTALAEVSRWCVHQVSTGVAVHGRNAGSRNSGAFGC
jgi:hypothetical protein